MFVNYASILLSALTLASCFDFELENVGRQDLNDTVISLNDPIDPDYNWTLTMKTLTLEIEKGKAFAGLYKIVANCSSKTEDVSCRGIALLPDVVKNTCESPLSSMKSRLAIYSSPYIRACHGDTILVTLSKRVIVSKSLGDKIEKNEADTSSRSKNKSDITKWLHEDGPVRESGPEKKTKPSSQFVMVDDEEESDDFDD